jgi:hypothetical protein
MLGQQLAELSAVQEREWGIKRGLCARDTGWERDLDRQNALSIEVNQGWSMDLFRNLSLQLR